MSQEIDLKQIERKAYLSFYQDGIWDLFIGLSFIGMAVGVLYNNTGITAIIPALALVIVPGLKKLITLPRLGYVKLSPEREGKIRKNISALVLLMTFTAVLGGVVFSAYTGNSGWQRWIKSLALIPFGAVLSLIAGAVGFLYGIKRVLIYAVLILVVFVIGHILELRPTFHFTVIGLPMTLVGFALLFRFIGKYPKPGKGVSDGIRN
jgi:hypothetical protein